MVNNSIITFTQFKANPHKYIHDKKLFIFDLDNTLAQNGKPISKITKKFLETLIKKPIYLGIISGRQLENILQRIYVQKILDTKNSIFIGTNNGACLYEFKIKNNKLQKYVINQELLTTMDYEKITKVVKQILKDIKLPIPVRGKQIIKTPSSVIATIPGIDTPEHIKNKFDPDKKIRIRIISKIKELLTSYNVNIAGRTSIDITKHKVNKAQAIKLLIKYVNLSKNNAIFIGDEFYQQGNDLIVAQNKISSIFVQNPTQTQKLLSILVNLL